MELHLSGHATYATNLTIGGVSYGILVYTPAPARKVPADEEVLRLLASPEALRDQLLADQEGLLKELRATIPLNGGVHSARVERPVLPGKQPEPPMLSNRPLSDPEKAEVLKVAEREIGDRIATVKDHYKELHAAARKAFPLRECLLAK